MRLANFKSERESWLREAKCQKRKGISMWRKEGEFFCMLPAKNIFVGMYVSESAKKYSLKKAEA